MDHASDEAFWDARYSSSAPIWSGNPNPILVEAARDLAPGIALDVGSGEGADAVWLARRGWTVHAVDISSVALAVAASNAEREGVAARVSWMHRDLLEWSAPAAAYDLVSAQFLHLARKPRRQVFAGLAEAVAPGGMLLIVGHHPSDLETAAKRPGRADVLFTPEDAVEALDPAGWDIVACEVRPRAVEGPEGAAITVRDTVLLARRKRGLGHSA